MNLKEVYASIGNYEDAKQRLLNDQLIARFLGRFLNDPSYQELHAAWADQDDERIFRAAHTLKGVCANLAMTHLCELSSRICEAYRPGNEALRGTLDLNETMQQLDRQYQTAVDAIRQISI